MVLLGNLSYDPVAFTWHNFTQEYKGSLLRSQSPRSPYVIGLTVSTRAN